MTRYEATTSLGTIPLESRGDSNPSDILSRKTGISEVESLFRETVAAPLHSWMERDRHKNPQNSRGKPAGRRLTFFPEEILNSGGSS